MFLHVLLAILGIFAVLSTAHYTSTADERAKVSEFTCLTLKKSTLKSIAEQ